MKITTDISKNIDWVIRKGAYNSFTITFTQSGSAFNISSYVFTLNLKKIGDDTNVVQLTEADAEITNGGATGILTIVLDETNSNLLNVNTYYYELKYVVATKNYTLLQGSAQVNSQFNFEDVETTLSIAVNLLGNNLDAAVTLASGSGSGTSIQFQDEGVNLGNNEADTVDFVGAGVTATRTADKITVTIPGSSATAWGSITGTLSDQTDLNTALGLKAPLASPPFTGTPTAPTAALGTSTTQIATTAFVQTEIEIIKNLQQIGGMGLM